MHHSEKGYKERHIKRPTPEITDNQAMYSKQP